jgi:hypothetical protein
VFYNHYKSERTPWDLNWADFEFTAMTAFVYLQREAGDWAVEIGAETVSLYLSWRPRPFRRLFQTGPTDLGRFR